MDRPFTIIENAWIPLADGTRLAARIFLPDNATADPVPAVFEFLPYRKRDGTAVRDESTYPVFAAAGIAGVRVDIRGSGESEGVIDGEYTELELANACELIQWIAAQPWSNGKVGMMGISWGGFNALQVAARRPPALKAVISIASTTDRYNDDIHYKNGCHLSAQLSWAATMLAYQSRAPDPEIVGERWKAMWLERLEQEPFFMEEWLAHQRRDGFWRHGSVCENFADIDVPVMVIAGWADGYRNTPLKLVEGMTAAGKGDRVQALIGPWVHKYPHFAWPKPRADFLGEAIRFWKRWLADEQNGAETVPQLRAFITDAARPQLRRAEEPGRWVAMPAWQRPRALPYHIAADGSLAQGPATANAPLEVTLASPLATGVAAGEYFTLKPDAEMAGDQRIDDAGSVVFETAPLSEAVEILGFPTVTLHLKSDRPVAHLVARLVDVHPDGASTRVSFGVLNLTHRDSDASPEPMPVGTSVEVTLRLDACGYRFPPGHRLRLSLSSAYWPMILPPPEPVVLTLDRATLTLGLPALGAHETVTVKAPDNPDPLPVYPVLKPAETARSVTRDLMTGTTHYRIHEDTGLARHPTTGLATRQVRSETWSIGDDDPSSLEGRADWVTEMERPGFQVSTACETRLTATATEWIVTARLTAREGETPVFEKRFERRVARDLM